MVHTRSTNFLEKGINSLINVIAVFILFLVFVLLFDVTVREKKLIFILLLLVYQIAIILFNKNVSLGMTITKTRWKKEYSLYNQFIHAALYTASFSTLLFWVYFPFDLFLFNILFLQIPTILLTGSTLHGYLAGKMTTVKSREF